MNREAWLSSLLFGLAPILEEAFKGATATLDSWRVSVGETKRGELVSIRDAGDTLDLFVSPSLDDPIAVAEALLSAMIEASVGGDSYAFKRLSSALGFTQARRAANELRLRLYAVLKPLGTYPHRAPAAIPTLKGRLKVKQATRLLKASCTGCGCVIRITAKWVAFGLPTCQCGTAFKVAS
jgi:hypothetical protein